MSLEEFKAGGIITLKKQHPCGSNNFRILRTGADFRIRCEGCGHELLIPRNKLMKMIRQK
ncbi:MAG: DUF951 domain-containing protein [Oribacterium sp.]|nr:DUF951 domain-containing protein [Oribacterium sp.]MDY6317479.1 DUF951 domain-containing protein [Oribacterium sp.]